LAANRAEISQICYHVSILPLLNFRLDESTSTMDWFTKWAMTFTVLFVNWADFSCGSIPRTMRRWVSFLVPRVLGFLEQFLGLLAEAIPPLLAGFVMVVVDPKAVLLHTISVGQVSVGIGAISLQESGLSHIILHFDRLAA
jgi:hypothetical protein